MCGGGISHQHGTRPVTWLLLALSCQVYSEKPELRTEQRALRTVQSGSVSEFKPVHKESADTAASAVQGTNSVKRNQTTLHWGSRRGARRAGSRERQCHPMAKTFI